MRQQAFCLLLALAMGAYSLNAQQEETVLGNHGMQFTGVWINWNNQITPFNNTNAYVSGWQYGLEFGKALYLAYGRYNLRDYVRWDNSEVFDMHFHAFKIGYGVNAYKAFHPIIDVDFGPGRMRFDDVEDKIFVVQPAAGVEINAFRWVRICLMGGYRIVTDNSIPAINDNAISGFFGQATLRLGMSWGRHHSSKKSEKSRWDDWSN